MNGVRQCSASKPAQVTCYSGRTYAERPQSFLFEGQAHKVKSIEKEWHQPGGKYFLVRTNDDRLFELCYNEQQDEWSATERVFHPHLASPFKGEGFILPNHS